MLQRSTNTFSVNTSVQNHMTGNTAAAAPEHERPLYDDTDSQQKTYLGDVEDDHVTSAPRLQRSDSGVERLSSLHRCWLDANKGNDASFYETYRKICYVHYPELEDIVNEQSAGAWDRRL